MPGRGSGRSHVHMVIAVLAVLAALTLASACNSASSSSPGSGSTHSVAPPPQPSPPPGLRVKQVGVTVHLRWRVPGNGGASSFEVTRSGVALDTLSSTTFVDTTAKPGHRYVYRVISVRGVDRSRPALAAIKVAKPSLARARLTGLFNVEARSVSSSGFKHLSGTATYAWHFTPTCAAGPCAARWSDDGLHAVATRSGSSYSFTVTGFMGVTCGGAHTSSTATVHLHVMRAQALSGRWKAFQFHGTIDVETAPQLGCVASSNVQNLTGDFVS
jgi:hypothetical protein